MKNLISYSKEYGEYYIWRSTYGIKSMKYFKSPEEAEKYIKLNPKKCLEIEGSNASSPDTEWASQSKAEFNDKHNQSEDMNMSKRFLIGAIVWFVGLGSYTFYEYTECKKYITGIYNSKPGMWVIAPQEKVTENIFFTVTQRNFLNRARNNNSSIPISVKSSNLIGFFGVPVIVLLLLALATRIKPSTDPKNTQ